ncbi:MAG: MFS transporter, partial [Stellaceae bacterium]
RIGGLRTVLAGSVCQVTALIGFLLTQNEAGLFWVSAWFGLGFSGIIPAYVLAIRELFPASEAAWRIPTILLFTGSGMAAGSWLAGAIFDHVGFYQAAFAAGIAINLLHIVVVGGLVLRQRLRAMA